ncbi:MAG: hypothetical protein J5777_05020 [Clostridiales bacterium]|nr:hypothetical protein [Clostridiales bacterium]
MAGMNTSSNYIYLDNYGRSADFNNPAYRYFNDQILQIYMMLEEEYDKGIYCFDAAHNVYKELNLPAFTWMGIRLFATEVYRELDTLDRSGSRDINPFAETVSY